MVLWHINYWRLYNAKYCLYIYIKYIWFVNIFLITFLNELQLIFCTQLNGPKYCYVTVIIKHQSFVYTLLNGQTFLFLTIQFNISHLHLGAVAIEKGAFGSSSTKVANFTLYIYIYIYISHPGFNPSLKHLISLVTLNSCDTTKQSVCG